MTKESSLREEEEEKKEKTGSKRKSLSRKSNIRKFKEGPATALVALVTRFR